MKTRKETIEALISFSVVSSADHRRQLYRCELCGLDMNDAYDLDLHSPDCVLASAIRYIDDKASTEDSVARLAEALAPAAHTIQMRKLIDRHSEVIEKMDKLLQCAIERSRMSSAQFHFTEDEIDTAVALRLNHAFGMPTDTDAARVRIKFHRLIKQWMRARGIKITNEQGS